MSSPLPTILLVEDNDDDVFAMQRALRKAQAVHPLQVVTDGQKAIDYLSGTGTYQDRNDYPLPSLIFLDLKLPYVGGFEFLEWMRQRPELRELKVIVLTSSAEQSDRDRAEMFAVHGYLVKPPEPKDLSRFIGSITPPP
ncbi:MAG: response regulator [Limisphaerales bacterium]